MHNGHDADDFYIQKDVGHTFLRKNFHVRRKKSVMG